MGAFCVFGISRSLCKKAAEKKTLTRERIEVAPGERERFRDLSPAEWAVKRDELAERMFAESTRRVKISPELDAPQFCRDWLSTDPGHVRDTEIMVRGPKRDKHGNEVKKDGAVVETWLEYKAECERLGIKAVHTEAA